MIHPDFLKRYKPAPPPERVSSKDSALFVARPKEAKKPAPRKYLTEAARQAAIEARKAARRREGSLRRDRNYYAPMDPETCTHPSGLASHGKKQDYCRHCKLRFTARKVAA